MFAVAIVAEAKTSFSVHVFASPVVLGFLRDSLNRV